jgi:hypothetical protein
MKSTAALTAQAVRKELKATYPGIKFSVTSETYSGGDSVRVEYTDFIPSNEVNKLLVKYQAGSFDGMQDIYEYTNVNPDIPQTKYLFVTRNMSVEVRDQILAEIRSNNATCENVEYNSYNDMWGNISALVYRMFVERTYKNTELKPTTKKYEFDLTDTILLTSGLSLLRDNSTNDLRTERIDQLLAMLNK